MLTDAVALALAWLAFRIARRPSDWQRTYGFDRFQVLAAYSNGLTLFFIALAIGYEAVHRLRGRRGAGRPAAGGGGRRPDGESRRLRDPAWGGPDSLNIRGAMLHVLGDLLGSVAASWRRW